MNKRFSLFAVMAIFLGMGVLISVGILLDRWGNPSPSASRACTSFCLDTGDHCLLGYNSDGENVVKQIGQVFVNKRHVMKTGWEASTTGEYARWISKYGSITFGVGYQVPGSGMNEAGLMISTMALTDTVPPDPDERPALLESLWVQYLLDNFGTVAEVIASDPLIRVTSANSHFLVCDRTGACAVIEFLDGNMVAYTGSALPVKALSNSAYRDSLTALNDGKYWKVRVYDVNPDGPAARAGILKNDWIIAADGVDLEGVQSMETFYTILGAHQPGEEMEFTVIHPGKTEPVSIIYHLAPLPDDLDKYTFPPGIPAQQLSLGFTPDYPGDFITRFVTAAEWIIGFAPASADQVVAYTFEGLKAVSTEDTWFSAVFDPVNMRVYLRTNRNSQIRYLDFSSLDFSCGSPVMMLDIHAGDAGDLTDDLLEYSHQMVFQQTKVVAENSWQVDFSPLFVDTLLTGFEGYTCMEDNPVALDNPQLYVENHPPMLPPLAVWTALMLVRRAGPVWLVLTLLSLGFVIWEMVRRQKAQYQVRLAWILIVILLGPFGLLAYLWGNRRDRWASNGSPG